MKMIKKQYIAKVEADDDERTITAVISTDMVDRDDEVMKPNGADLESFMKNPVVLWAHDYHSPSIGKALWVKTTRKNVTAKTKFADTPRADEIYQLYKGGYLKAFSVGFIPTESHKPEPKEIEKRPELSRARNIIDKWELLEFSAVPVPANPEALATAVKTKEIMVSKELQTELGLEDEETFYPATIQTDTETSSDGTQWAVYDIEYDAVLKPYPNEHACRLKPPNYPKYRRQNCAQKHDGKCIDVIYGIKSPKKSEIQSLRFDKKIWTAGSAKSVCKARGGTFEAASSSSAEIEDTSIAIKGHPKLRKRIALRKHIDPNKCAEVLTKILKGRID